MSRLKLLVPAAVLVYAMLVAVNLTVEMPAAVLGVPKPASAGYSSASGNEMHWVFMFEDGVPFPIMRLFNTRNTTETWTYQSGSAIAANMHRTQGWVPDGANPDMPPAVWVGNPSIYYSTPATGYTLASAWEWDSGYCIFSSTTAWGCYRNSTLLAWVSQPIYATGNLTYYLAAPWAWVSNGLPYKGIATPTYWVSP